ncbi:MAG: hypothetical protein FWD79_09525 [Desulfobulbus sp.]|nr:hypothetical protein [Desulfobulbus sp.]
MAENGTEKKEQKQGLYIFGRLKKKERRDGRNGNPDRFFFIVDALGMEGVLTIQVNPSDFDRYAIGQEFKSSLDFTVRREGWLTFKPVVN